MSFWEALPWMIAAAGLFSFLSVSSWASERRKEREAYYRSEAIKKLAEMQGSTPESVLQLLRETLTPREGPSAWATPAYYKNEMLKEIARMPGGAEVFREQEKRAAERVRVGTRLGGLVSMAVGIALMPFLWMTVPGLPVYLAGLIPAFVGLALLTYSYVLAPRS